MVPFCLYVNKKDFKAVFLSLGTSDILGWSFEQSWWERWCPIDCSRHSSSPINSTPPSGNNQCLQTLSKVPWEGKISLAENSTLNYITHRELWSIYLSSSSITKSSKRENACVSNVVTTCCHTFYYSLNSLPKVNKQVSFSISFKEKQLTKKKKKPGIQILQVTVTLKIQLTSLYIISRF